MYVYIYVCVLTYTVIFMYIHAYIFIHVYTCMHHNPHTGQLKLKQSRDEAAPSTSSRGQSHKHSPLRYNDP